MMLANPEGIAVWALVIGIFWLGRIVEKKCRTLILVLLLSSVSYAQVLDTAQRYIEKKVGNGKCWSFVKHVLKESGHIIDTSSVVDSAQPGDIFITYGFYQVKRGEYTDTLVGIGSHIAIIVENFGKKRYLIIEQNVNGHKDPVSSRIIDLQITKNTYSLGYVFVRPHHGKFTRATHRLLRGWDQFRTTNDTALN